MTSQTKKFIEPSDILGLRLDCADCGATLLLPISHEVKIKQIYVCPHCQIPWVKLPNGSTAELAIAECMERIKTLSQLLGSGQFEGFSLLLEIKEEIKHDRN